MLKTSTRKINFKSKILQDLAETSNDNFESLKRKWKITVKELKCFIINHKKVARLGKMNLLPKIHKRLHSVSRRPVISNCGAPTEKASEFLDNKLKLIMQESLSYIKYSYNFMLKIKDLKDIPKDAFFVTADALGLYHSIPHEAGLRFVREVLNQRNNKRVSTNDLDKIAKFLLRNNYLELNGNIGQISDTATGTKLAPTHVSILK